MSNFSEFLLWERSSLDTIDVKKTYIDIAQDLVAGIILSQIIYWHLPSKKTETTKLRIERDGHLWIARTREEWWEECRATVKQVDRALKILKEAGLIETKVYKFKNNPTVHIRVLEDAFLEAWDKAIHEPAPINSFRTREATKGNSGNKRDISKKEITILPNREEPNSLTGNNEIPSLGTTYSTQSTPKTTPKKTAENNSPPGDAVADSIESLLNGEEPSPDNLCAALVQAGVSSKVAIELVDEYPAERIIAQLAYLPARTGANPAGLLVTAIRDNWEEPNMWTNGGNKRANAISEADVEAKAQEIAKGECQKLDLAQKKIVDMAVSEGKSLVIAVGYALNTDLYLVAREILEKRSKR